MSSPIRTDRPVTFYDGRNKYDHDLYLVEILFENDELVLGHAQFLIFDRQGNLEPQDEVYPILFNRQTRQVLVDEFDSWYGENPESTRAPCPRRPVGG